MKNRELFHRVVFLGSIALIIAGIPFCRPFMSVGGGILVANWFLEGKFLEKWNALKNNKIVLVSLLLFFVYVCWLIFTNNFSEGGKNIWMKTPLLFFPVIFATTKPLTNNEFHNLLKVYLIGLLISSIYGFLVYHIKDLVDKREIAVFISYIRFEMNLCFALFTIIYLFVNDTSRWQRYLFLGLFLWFLFLIFYIGALTAIIILAVVSLLFVFKKMIENNNKFYRFFIPILFLCVLISGIGYTYSIVKQYYNVDFDISKADSLTTDGNAYFFSIQDGIIENGHYVNAYICKKELEETWNKRSKIKYNDLDINNQHGIEPTLIRYLNSKGLRKDKQGVEQLTVDDIKHIENGIANVVYLNKFGYKARIYTLLWEFNDYKSSGSVYGYTMPQRFDLWKNALFLIKKHLLIGVGTGDVKDTFANQLFLTDSSLKDTGKLCHNQFLLFLIQFGIIGFLIITFSIYYPFFYSGRFKNDLYFVFMLILFCAMLTDDTFERQDGLTFFAFFQSFFLFQMPFINKQVSKIK